MFNTFLETSLVSWNIIHSKFICNLLFPFSSLKLLEIKLFILSFYFFNHSSFKYTFAEVFTFGCIKLKIKNKELGDLCYIQPTGVRVCVLSSFSRVWLMVAPLTVARQAPLSVWFPRQEYWSGLPCPPPGDLLDPGIKPVSLTSPALAGRHQLAIKVCLKQQKSAGITPPSTMAHSQLITSCFFLRKVYVIAVGIIRL